MPLPEFVKALAEKKFGAFCERRVPPHIRHKVNLSYTIRGNSITIVKTERLGWRGLSGLTALLLSVDMMKRKAHGHSIGGIEIGGGGNTNLFRR